MTKCTFIRNILVMASLILIASCAKISSPVGGPKDKEPPVVVKSDPVSGQTNFSGKKITITFNEFVTLDKINEKFMVSPPMEKKPRVLTKGKSVVVEYDDKLRDSTTYTFYFQDAIRDLNESNPIDNYQFVFSTGDVVDSLSVTGNVYSAFSLDPPENTLLLLYRDLSDTAVMKKLPDYITRAGKTGYFRINNVKEGTYRLYALKDADNSKNFNLPDEEFAFLDTLVRVSAERNYILPVTDTLVPELARKKISDTAFVKGEHQLILFKPAKKMRYLTSSPRDTRYKLVYTLSLPPDTLDFDFYFPGTGTDSYFVERSRERDTMTVWITDSTLYSEPQLTTIVTYPFTDSLGDIIKKQDTLIMRFLIPRAPRVKQKPAPLKISSNLSSGSLAPGQNIIFFNSPTPFRDPDTSKIRMYELKDTLKIKIPYRIEKIEGNSCRLEMHTSLAPGKKYMFVAGKASFGNIYGDQTDSAGINFSVRTEETYGRLKLNISNFEGKRIIQLLNSQEKIVREAKASGDGIVEFTVLDRGSYRLRVIYDFNGDGKWTTGDFTLKRQPEPVSFYFQELEMRENLWLDQDWDISLQNVKKVKSKPQTGSRTGQGRL